MNTKVCTCGAAEANVDVDVIGLPESQILERVASQAGFSPTEAVRLLRAIARAPKEDAESLIAWMVREQIRLMKVAHEKSEARAAAIARASGER